MRPAGEFNCRIEVQIATEARDESNDVTRTWGPHSLRWAKRRDRGAREFFGAQQTLREGDVMFTVRADNITMAIAPETYRVKHLDRVFLIVGVSLSDDRAEVDLLCAGRPDQRGSAAPET